MTIDMDALRETILSNKAPENATCYDCRFCHDTGLLFDRCTNWDFLIDYPIRRIIGITWSEEGEGQIHEVEPVIDPTKGCNRWKLMTRWQRFRYWLRYPY